ncbi:MAG: amidophosphoribosyltransferase, partial [Methanobrevibacter sp.]
SYALTILVDGELYAVRDPMGIKPLAIAKRDDDFILASETVAFDVIGAEFIRDIVPGEVVYFENNEINSYMLESAGKCKLSHCMFEYVYFARPDSTIDGINVYQTRMNIGRELHKLYPIDADLVIPVPDSSIPAAIGYSRASGIPYGEGLIKNRYVGRTFIMPTQEERELAVRLKLNPIKEAIKGKKIILIDDSIVRGTTSKQLLNLVKEAEPAEIHFLIGCPPVISPCYYGVAMATKKELIAANYSIDEIKDQLDIDSLGYITLEALVEAIGMPKENLCLGCVNEEYPTELPEGIEAETYYKP